MMIPDEVARSALAERVSRLADEAPTADGGSRILLAQRRFDLADHAVDFFQRLSRARAVRAGGVLQVIERRQV